MTKAVGLTLAMALLAGSAAGAQDMVKRGEYLAAIMDCTGCHTSGALIGQPDPALYLAGSNIGFEIPGLGIFYPPNLTPDPETGLGGWSESDIAAALRTGVRPDGRELAPAMPWRSYSALSDEDVAALAAYLRSLEPVVNQAPTPVGPGERAAAPYLTVMMPQ
jgi:mono/diheme cytochrome c family protein